MYARESLFDHWVEGPQTTKSWHSSKPINMRFAVFANGRVGNLFCFFVLAVVRAVQQVLRRSCQEANPHLPERLLRLFFFLSFRFCLNFWDLSLEQVIPSIKRSPPFLHRPGTETNSISATICFMKFARLFAKCFVIEIGDLVRNCRALACETRLGAWNWNSPLFDSERHPVSLLPNDLASYKLMHKNVSVGRAGFVLPKKNTMDFLWSFSPMEERYSYCFVEQKNRIHTPYTNFQMSPKYFNFKKFKVFTHNVKTQEKWKKF